MCKGNHSWDSKRGVSPTETYLERNFFYSESDFPCARIETITSSLGLKCKQKHDLLLGVVYPFKLSYSQGDIIYWLVNVDNNVHYFIYSKLVKKNVYFDVPWLEIFYHTALTTVSYSAVLSTPDMVFKFCKHYQTQNSLFHHLVLIPISQLVFFFFFVSVDGVFLLFFIYLFMFCFRRKKQTTIGIQGSEILFQWNL